MTYQDYPRPFPKESRRPSKSERIDRIISNNNDDDDKFYPRKYPAQCAAQCRNPHSKNTPYPGGW